MKRIITLIMLVCVIFLMSGCGFELPIINNDHSATDDSAAGDPGVECDYISLDITKCESALIITATGCETFAGITDRIKGTDFDGGIIKEVSTCADWGGFFSGWYDIEGAGAKAARYTLRPEEKQQSETISLGINYYTLILEASFFDAESVEIEYGSDITINGLNGDFSLLVFVLGKNTDWLVGTAMTRMYGTVDQRGSLTLSYGADSYSITSTAPVRGLLVESYENNDVVSTAGATTEKTSYAISFANGNYIIQ